MFFFLYLAGWCYARLACAVRMCAVKWLQIGLLRGCTRCRCWVYALSTSSSLFFLHQSHLFRHVHFLQVQLTQTIGRNAHWSRHEASLAAGHWWTRVGSKLLVGHICHNHMGHRPRTRKDGHKHSSRVKPGIHRFRRGLLPSPSEHQTNWLTYSHDIKGTKDTAEHVSEAQVEVMHARPPVLGGMLHCWISSCTNYPRKI